MCRLQQIASRKWGNEVAKLRARERLDLVSLEAGRPPRAAEGHLDCLAFPQLREGRAVHPISCSRHARVEVVADAEDEDGGNDAANDSEGENLLVGDVEEELHDAHREAIEAVHDERGAEHHSDNSRVLLCPPEGSTRKAECSGASRRLWRRRAEKALSRRRLAAKQGHAQR